MRDIYRRVPINKTAALVTKQRGCAIDDDLTDEQLRENLVAKFKSLQSYLLTLPKKSDQRRQIGVEIQLIQQEINKIRPKKKAPGVENYFIDAARESLTKAQFDILMRKAIELMRKNKPTERDV